MCRLSMCKCANYICTSRFNPHVCICISAIYTSAHLHIRTPALSAHQHIRIICTSLKLAIFAISMKTKIAVAKGDGIGPEIMAAVLKIFAAGNVQLDYEYVEMGKSYF